MDIPGSSPHPNIITDPYCLMSQGQNNSANRKITQLCSGIARSQEGLLGGAMTLGGSPRTGSCWGSSSQNKIIIAIDDIY
jgi:hypothetical protein